MPAPTLEGIEIQVAWLCDKSSAATNEVRTNDDPDLIEEILLAK